MKQILLFVIILVLIPFCFSIGCIAFDPDAPKRDPEYSRAVRKGAKAKLELHVVDDEGNPVPDVNVKAIMWMVTDAYTLNGQTDTNGVFIIKGKIRNEIVIRLKKDGYYNSEKKIVFWGKQRQVKNGKWQPYGEKVEVVLRKKRNPTNLIANHYETQEFSHTKLLNQWVGFDLRENDFVEPNCKGKIADFEVMIEWDEKIYSDYTGMRVKIRFTEPYSGYYEVPKYLNSDLKSPYTAIPDNITSTLATYYTKKIGDDWEEYNFDKNSCWVVRSRPVIDKNGNLVSANYSVIYNINYSWNTKKQGGFSIYRAFNPIPNDTNLEPVDIPTSDGIRIRTFPDPNLPIPLKQPPLPVENN